MKLHMQVRSMCHLHNTFVEAFTSNIPVCGHAQNWVEMSAMIPFRDYKVNVHGDRSEEEAVSELTREMEVRRRLYDRWVAEGRLSRVEAHDRLSRLMSAIRRYTGAALHVPLPLPTLEEPQVASSGDLPKDDVPF